MQKIKVAQIITRMDWGGSPDVVRLLCTRLDADRYDLTLITGTTRSASSKTMRFFDAFGSRIVTVASLQREINVFSDFRALSELKALLGRARYDLVHTHTAKAGFLGRLAAASRGIKAVVHTPHGHNLYGYFNPFTTRLILGLERYASARCQRIIAQTKLEQHDLISSGIAQPEQVVVIPLGVEFQSRLEQPDSAGMRQELGLAAGETVVTMIGRLERIKGAEFFVRAAEECLCRGDRVKFLLIGEGSLHQKLREYIDHHGLKEKVILTGWRDDVSEILSVTDILVTPSLNEAVGMALIEAQGAGIPVVASRVGGIPEVVQEGASGLLVEPADCRALSEAISALLRDQGRRRIMGEAARLWVKGKFSVEAMVRATEKLYEELLSR